MEFKTVWIFDTQDMRKEPTGFQGRATSVRGLTDREFDSSKQAIAQMEAKVTQGRRWRYIGGMAGFEHVWQHQDREGFTEPWFLCLTTALRVVGKES